MSENILKIFYDSKKDYSNKNLIIWNEFVDNNLMMYTYEKIDCLENKNICESINVDEHPVIYKIINSNTELLSNNFNYVQLHEFAFINEDVNDDEEINNDDEVNDEEKVTKSIIEIVEKEIVEKEIVEKEIVEKEIVEIEIVEKEIVEIEIVEIEIVEKEIVEKEIVEKEIVEKEIVEKEIEGRNIKIEIVEESDDEETDKEETKEEKKPEIKPIEIKTDNDLNNVILVYLESCGFCKKFMPVWDEAKDKYSDKYNFIKLNCGENECTGYEYRGVPTIFIRDKENKNINTSVGYKEFSAFEAFLLNKEEKKPEIKPIEIKTDNDLNNVILVYLESCGFCKKIHACLG